MCQFIFSLFDLDHWRFDLETISYGCLDLDTSIYILVTAPNPQKWYFLYKNFIIIHFRMNKWLYFCFLTILFQNNMKHHFSRLKKCLFWHNMLVLRACDTKTVILSPKIQLAYETSDICPYKSIKIILRSLKTFFV